MKIKATCLICNVSIVEGEFAIILKLHIHEFHNIPDKYDWIDFIKNDIWKRSKNYKLPRMKMEDWL